MNRQCKNWATILIFIANLFRLSYCKYIDNNIISSQYKNYVVDDGEDFEVCETEACMDAASTIISNMNVSADPCEDFFEFACGGWVKKHPVPSTESHWNQFNRVDELLNFQIKDILEEAASEDDPGPVKAAKVHYRTCMDQESIEKEGLIPLVGLLEVLGGWPIASKTWTPTKDFEWQSLLSDMSRLLAISPIIQIYVYVDRKNSNRSVITIDQPTLVIPRSMLLDHKTYSIQTNAYKLWIYETANLISKHSGENVAKDLVYSQAQEIVEFESEIAKISSPNEMRRNGFRTYNPMTLRQLQAWTDTASPDQIKWLNLIRNIFNDTEIDIDWSERVIIREVDYLFNLAKLLEKTPVRVIANYLHWRIVKTLSRDLNEKMQSLAFTFDQVFTGASQDQPRWKECIHSTNGALNMAVGWSYVQKHFDDSAKKAALEMSNNIKSVFASEMNKVDWMDKATLKAALEKVESMAQLIGYPYWFNNVTHLEHMYNDLKTSDIHFKNVITSRRFNSVQMLSKLRKPINRNSWTISPAVVNAFYSPQTNSIIFPAGILQPPFFSKGRIEALNYGAIGVVIGHEITHGFDDVGRQSDTFGNLAQWWSEKTIETYIDKAQCFVEQYGSYRVPLLDSLLFTEATVNGVNTLGENIADNGGMNSAFLAYRKYVEVYGQEPRLPGLEMYSPEQLFFIAFATNWCESNTKESLLQEILSDPHSPHKFRVQGTISNSPEFAKLFKCKPVQNNHSCKIW